MELSFVPILLFVVLAGAMVSGLLLAGWVLGPRRSGRVKAMPYESGMDPIHAARRRFDVRFHLVAIAFLIFDVELLFLYPWAVAARSAAPGEAARGLDAAIDQGLVADRHLVFWGVMVFLALLVVGYVYDWRKGVFQWR